MRGTSRGRVRALIALAVAVSFLPLREIRAQDTASVQPAPIDSARMRAARELVDLMQMDKVIRAGNVAMAEAQAAGNPDMAPFKDVLIEWANTYLTWERMGPRMAALYAEALTEAELRDLMAFYRTPTGQKVIAVTPDLTQRSAAVGAEMAEQYLPQLEAMMQTRIDELTGIGPAKP